MTTRIGVSVLNYQAAGETLRCIDSLLSSLKGGSGLELAIQVADNQSSEADFSQLEAGLTGRDSVSLTRHEQNLGFAAGHNRNIARLLEEKPDFIWLLNNDCEILPGTPHALVRCAEAQPGVGIWGATLLDSADGPLECAGGCRYRAWLSSYRSIGRGESLARVDDLPEPAMDYVAGASLFFPVSTLLNGLEPPRSFAGVGQGQWLNEEFFLYFEELDLAQRLSDGLGMAWCRQARVVHAGGLGTGSVSGRRSIKGEYHSTLSALKFTHLYRPGLLWLVAPSRLLAKTLVNAATLRWDLLPALYAAYRAFFSWRAGRDG